MIRKCFFWAHLALGLAAGSIILVLAATGMVLAFEDPVVQWLDRGYRVQVAAAPMPLRAIAAEARKGLPKERLSAISLERGPASPVTLQFGADKAYLADPGSGKVLGPSAPRARAFFRQVEGIHRWFGQDGKAKGVALQVKGAANGAFFIMILSGLCLWWPRPKNPPVLWFKKGARGKARDFNWHNVLGLWAWIPIVLISGTGLILSYGWANDLLYRLTGNEVPVRPQARVERLTGQRGQDAPPVDWDGALLAAQAQAPAWRAMTLRAPRPGRDEISVSIVTEDAPPPRGRGTLTLRAGSGEFLRWEPYEAQNWGRKLRLWARWTHTGQSLGLLGQSLMALACVAILALAWTGFALSWRRFFGAPKARP